MRFIKRDIYNNTRGTFRFVCGNLSYTAHMTTYASAEKQAAGVFKMGDVIRVYRKEGN